jgi:hypothetical protein
MAQASRSRCGDQRERRRHKPIKIAPKPVARYIGVPTSGTVLPNVYVTVAVALAVVDWPPAKFPPPPVIISMVEVNTGILKLPAPVYGANRLVSLIVAEPIPLRPLNVLV